MSVKNEQPLYELRVQVLLLYHHPNFKYCHLFVSGIELRTNRQTDQPTNGPTDGWLIRSNRITKCHQRTFQVGHKEERFRCFRRYLDAILYVYLFKWDSCFSGVSAESRVLIHEYANMFDNDKPC